MSRSGFRFQKVLDVKRRVEDRQKQMVAVSMRVRIREERRLDELRALHDQHCEEMSRRENGPIVVMEEARGRAHLEDVMKQILRQAEVVAHSKRRLTELLDQLVKYRTERKVLEKLKQRRLEEWTQELQRRERKSADEIGVHAFLRNSKGDR